MNFTERLEKSRASRAADLGSNNTEGSIDAEYYGIENMRNPVMCLDLRLADGSRVALPYSYIMEINFEATEGIEITTSTKQIKITGRNLARLYDYLIAYRVKYIQANLGTDAGQEGLFVERIICN